MRLQIQLRTGPVDHGERAILDHNNSRLTLVKASGERARYNLEGVTEIKPVDDFGGLSL